MYRLFKSQHIRKTSDFQKFRQQSVESIYGGFFILKILEKERFDSCYCDLQPRIGIVTSKKIGNAVTRNHVRRIVRETFRLNKNYFKKNSDYLFIALRGISDKSNEEISQAILSACNKFSQKSACRLS